MESYWRFARGKGGVGRRGEMVFPFLPTSPSMAEGKERGKEGGE